MGLVFPSSSWKLNQNCSFWGYWKAPSKMLASRSEIASCQSWPFSAAVTSAPKVITLQGQKIAASQFASWLHWYLLSSGICFNGKTCHFLKQGMVTNLSGSVFLNNSKSPPKNWSLTRRWASLGCNPAAQAVTAILRICLTGSTQSFQRSILWNPQTQHGSPGRDL